MRLTLHADYGLRTLVYLAAAPDRVVSTTEIGRAYGISKNHLVRVAQSLRDAGFIRLTMGRSGGLTLARPTTAIRIGEVIRSLEPELRIVECFDPATNTCPIAPRCGLSPIIGDALDAFLASLNRYTIADVLRQSGPTLSSFFIPVGALTRRVAKTPAKAKAKTKTPAKTKAVAARPRATNAASKSGGRGQRSSRSTRRSRRQVSSSLPLASMAPRVVSPSRSAATPSRCR
ncbi:MAG: Rrf2 family transcriptional regulator [Myxococcales bacterium]|nr:Rrf2 family transcriptional regulator [Myxococcales bacterium]